jgi:hypothetical protein
MADSAAFPRHRHRPFVTAADGGTAGLHKPGYRVAAGGHAGDQALRDAVRDEAERAREVYIHDVSNAWKRRRDEWPGSETDDDAEVEARAGAIRNALLSRGHDPSEVDKYLDDCDDDDLINSDIGEHVAAFEEADNGRDARPTAVDRKIRLEEIYRERDHFLANEWRRGK